MAAVFENFEVNHTPFWPRIGRSLGGSLGVHAVAIAVILYVPAFRDALNIAFLFSGAEFVSRDYSRTTIGDDVQIVDLASGKFRYPDGYWAPEGVPPAATENPIAPQIISQAGSGLRIKPASTPTPTPEATPTPTPLQSPTPTIASSASPAGAGTSSGSDKKGEVAKEQKEQKELTPDEAQKELEKTAAANNIELPKEGEINKKALKDFGIYANEMKNNGKLDLEQPFEIVIESELDEFGKLKNPAFTKKAGDQNLADLSGRMIAALNDSGFLVYLKRINLDNPGTKIIFTVKMDKAELVATVESEASSADSARILAAGFKAALGYGMLARKGKDEEVLLRNTTVEPDGKRIKFNLTMPRQPVVDLIKKQLAAS